MNVSISRQLRVAAATMRADRVSVQALLEAHGSATHGVLLVLFAIPCLLPVPGVDIVLGLGVAAVSGQIWSGPSEVRVPACVGALKLPRRVAQRVLVLLASFYAIGGHWTKARLGHLTGGTYRWLVATAAALMALLLVLPIPLGDFLPAGALIVLGFGLIFRDGAAILFAFATAAVAVLFNLTVVVAVWHFGGAWLVQWIHWIPGVGNFL